MESAFKRTGLWVDQSGVARSIVRHFQLKDVPHIPGDRPTADMVRSCWPRNRPFDADLVMSLPPALLESASHHQCADGRPFASAHAGSVAASSSAAPSMSPLAASSSAAPCHFEAQAALQDSPELLSGQLLEQLVRRLRKSRLLVIRCARPPKWDPLGN